MSEMEVGDAVYLLAAESTVLALGVVAPRTALDADTLDGYDSTAFWRKGDAVNADLLDGIDSTGFLRRVGGVGAVQLLGFGGTTDALGQVGFFHSLGVTPTVCLITPKNTTLEPVWLGADASFVVTGWYSDGVPMNNYAVQGSALVGA